MTPEQFRAWRERLGLSLTGAAAVLGVSRRLVIMYQAPADAPPTARRAIPPGRAILCNAIENLVKLGADVTKRAGAFDDLEADDQVTP
jgi:transcriptional regulator with XRE-family HTH domain